MKTQYNDITRFFTILKDMPEIVNSIGISRSIRLNTLWLSLIFFASCQSTAVERERTGIDRFKTTAPSLIYFKNIKSIKYQINRNPKTQMDFYRPKTFIKSDNIPAIYPVIIHNWLEDESYLTFETKNIGEETKILVTTITEDTILLDWPEKDYLDQLEFVRQLENTVISEKNIFIQDLGEEKRMLNYSLAERTSFSATMQDFLNLTETASSRAIK